MVLIKKIEQINPTTEQHHSTHKTNSVKMPGTYSILFNTCTGSTDFYYIFLKQMIDAPADCEEELIWFILDHWTNRTLYMDTLREYLLQVNPEAVSTLEKMYPTLTPVPRIFAPPGYDGKSFLKMWDASQLDLSAAFHIKKTILNTIATSQQNKQIFYEEIRKSAFPIVCIKPNSTL